MIQPAYRFGSHLPALIEHLFISSGPVLELGAGLYSTPILHTLCKDRLLITVENDKEWLRQFEGMRSKEHWIVSDLKEVEEPSRYGLVLVDCLPDHTRRQAIDKYKSRADYLVLHDWGWKYNYPNPYKEWKYVSVYTSLEPFTAVYGQWVGPGVGG